MIILNQKYAIRVLWPPEKIIGNYRSELMFNASKKGIIEYTMISAQRFSGGGGT